MTRFRSALAGLLLFALGGFTLGAAGSYAQQQGALPALFRVLAPAFDDNSTAAANTSWVTAAIDRLMGVIRVDTTKTMCASGCDFSDLMTFRDWAIGRTFIGNVKLTLQISDGTYPPAASPPSNDQFFMAGDLWSHVRILGNLTTDGTQVRLRFNASSGNAPFKTYLGGCLNYIDGVDVFGENGYGGTGGSVYPRWNSGSEYGAFDIVGQGCINAGPHTSVHHVYYGVRADQGGYFNGGSGNGVTLGFHVVDSGDANFLIRFGATGFCYGCRGDTAYATYQDTSGNVQTLGSNVVFETGAHGYFQGFKGTGAKMFGMAGFSDGHGWVEGSETSGAGFAGFYVGAGGYLQLGGVEPHNNNTGIFIQGGDADADGANVHNNAADGVYVENGTIRAPNKAIRSAYNGSYGFETGRRGDIESPGSIAATVAAPSTNAQGNNINGIWKAWTGTACPTGAQNGPVNCGPDSTLFIN